MLLTRFRDIAARQPERIALHMAMGGAEYRTTTYGELAAAIASAGRAFSDLGIGPTDRVAILSENRPEWMITYLAVVSIGAVVVPLDAQLTAKEVAVLLANSGARAVCVSAATRDKLPPDGAITVVSFDEGNGTSFSALIARHPGAPLPPAREASEFAALLYTSGTTGDPKGVMLSQGNLASNCDSCIRLDLVGPEDNMLLLLPLHHTYPAMACMLLPLSLGAAITILNSLKGPDIIAALNDRKVSIVLGVPQLLAGLRRAIFEQIEKKPAPVRVIVRLLLGLNGLLRKTINVNIGKKIFGEVHARFGEGLRLFASGGARLDPEVYTDMAALGFTLIEGYGLTETSPVSTFNPLAKQKPGSIGIPVPGVEVRIDRPGEKGMGELVIRGPNVMMGYYQKPGATAEVIRDGWFHTGDLGHRDRDGYFFITGRSKEMIVLSTGKKIFPDELEAYYKTIPSVKEFCLVQTDRGLEAAVVPDFEYLRRMNLPNTRETIASEVEDLARQLPPYKRVMGIKIFKDPLPVTRLGKLRRALVRDLYLKDGGGEERRPGVPTEEGMLRTDTGKRVLACLEPVAPKKAIGPDDNLELDLGLDSLARVELVVSLERSFGISVPESFGAEVFTVRDVVERIDAMLEAGTGAAGGRVRLTWSEILRQEPSEDVLRSLRLERSLPSRIFVATARLLLIAFFKIFGRMTVRGAENLPLEGPYIIAPNHASYADAPLLMSSLPWSIGSRTFFLGHTKYFGGRVMSRIAKAVQVIPVDMDSKSQSAMQLSAYVLRHGKVLCAFPEGTRSRDGALKEFKKGVAIIAKELNVPVVPVAISGTFSLLPSDRKFPRPAKVSVVFGKPLLPGDLDYDGVVKKLYEEVVKLRDMP